MSAGKVLLYLCLWVGVAPVWQRWLSSQQPRAWAIQQGLRLPKQLCKWPQNREEHLHTEHLLPGKLFLDQFWQAWWARLVKAEKACVTVLCMYFWNKTKTVVQLALDKWIMVHLLLVTEKSNHTPANFLHLNKQITMNYPQVNVILWF